MPYFRIESSNYAHEETNDLNPNKLFYNENGEIFIMKTDGTLVPIEAHGLASEVTTIAGAPGRDGAQGPQGIPGEPGKDGKDGADGAPGPKGDKGDTGEKGEKGDKGDIGPQGIQGLKGDRGDQGLPGKDGAQGPAGKDGTNGKDGLPGLQGVAGPAGKDGKDGAQGLKGDKGDPGKDGAMGIQGPQGPSGNNLSNQTIILNSVAPTAFLTGVDVPQWSAIYTGQGGQLLVKADILAWTSSVGTRNWYLKKNGTVVATGSFFWNAANTHMTMPPIQYIDTSGAGTNTWSIALGSSLNADTNDRATITITEYTGISNLNVTALTAAGNVSGAYLVSTNAAGDEGGEIQLAKAPNGTLSGGITIDSYQNKLRIFEQGGTARGVSIDLSKAPAGVGGDLVWKTSGWVDAGQFVTMDNIKCTVTTSGSRGLSVAAVSGSFQAHISGTFGYISGVGGSATSAPITYTTTPSTSFFGWSFPNQGDGSTYLINDVTNWRFYRVTMMIGPGYTKNFISIERLG